MSRIKEMYFIPVVGTQRIGFNCSLYGIRLQDGSTEWVMVDLGVSFASCGHIYEIMLPDIEAAIKTRKPIALVITHAHEDHIGAVGYLWDKLGCPVYLSPFACEILRQKLGKAAADRIPLHTVEGRFSVGNFDMTMVHVNHSTPESRSIVFHTPFGHVVKTGDWKIDKDQSLEDPIHMQKFEGFGKEGVYAVLGDSTNIFQEGNSGSEASVYRVLRDFLINEKCEGQIIATCFASNLQRVYSIAKIAKEMGRKLFVLGRSMETFVRVGKKTGYVPDFPESCREDVKSVPKSKRFIICAGSQGDKRSGLSAIVTGKNKNIELGKGDLICFSSRAIPGNEDAIIDLQTMCISQGARVLTGLHLKGIHVSGHAHREEIRTLYRALNPQICVPLHGTQLNIIEHGNLARDMGINKVFTLKDGDVLRLFPEPAVVSRLENPGSRMFVGNSSKSILPTSGQVADFRQRSSRWGSVQVSILANNKKIKKARVLILGLLENDDVSLSQLVKSVEEKLQCMTFKFSSLEDSVKKLVKKSLREKGIDASPVISVVQISERD